MANNSEPGKCFHSTAPPTLPSISHFLDTPNTLKTIINCQFQVRKLCFLIVWTHADSKGGRSSTPNFLTSVSRGSLVFQGVEVPQPSAYFYSDRSNSRYRPGPDLATGRPGNAMGGCKSFRIKNMYY